jgi:transcriptional regulator with XRE-family HTH domain
MKMSELRTAGEIRQEDLRDLDYRREYQRTRLANEVAIKVIQYRVTHGLSQTALARLLGWRQPNVARLEAGEHEPSVATLARLADILGLDFSIEIKRGRVGLRRPDETRRKPTTTSERARTARKSAKRNRSQEVREFAARERAEA